MPPPLGPHLALHVVSRNTQLLDNPVRRGHDSAVRDSDDCGRPSRLGLEGGHAENTRTAITSRTVTVVIAWHCRRQGYGNIFMALSSSSTCTSASHSSIVVVNIIVVSVRRHQHRPHMVIPSSLITATDVTDGDVTGGRHPTLDQLDRPDTCAAKTQRSPAKSQSDRDKPAELTILSGTTLLAFAVSGWCSQLDAIAKGPSALQHGGSYRQCRPLPRGQQAML